ncbi:MAG: flagellar motor switch protein FliM [Verrucomicrobiota bacterium]|jgi:flagellar motor switch protein FliM
MPADESSAAVPDGLDEAPVEAPVPKVVSFPGANIPEAATPAAGPRRIHAVDFRQPSMFTAPELRKLRVRHDDFMRSLATRLSIYLRLELSLPTSKLQTVTFRKFTDSLALPAHLVLFKIEPLTGIGLLDIPPRLGLAIVDRMLGGTGIPVTPPRELTEIEVAVLEQAAQIILKEWCRHVGHLADSAPSLVGHENSPRFLQTALQETNMMTLSLEVRLGDAVEQLQLAFPQPMLQPLVGQLDPALAGRVPAEILSVPRPLQWNAELDELRVPLSAEWHGLSIQARDLAHLKVGDVLPVDARCSAQVEVRLARIPKFVARLGKRGNAWAVELLEPVKS